MSLFGLLTMHHIVPCHMDRYPLLQDTDLIEDVLVMHSSKYLRHACDQCTGNMHVSKNTNCASHNTQG